MGALESDTVAAAARVLDGEAFRLWAFMLANADHNGHWNQPQRVLVDALPRFVAGSRQPKPRTLRNVQELIAHLKAAGALRVVADGPGPVTFAVTAPTAQINGNGPRSAAPGRATQTGEGCGEQPRISVRSGSDNRRSVSSYEKSIVYEKSVVPLQSSPSSFNPSETNNPPASSVFSSREEKPAGGRGIAPREDAGAEPDAESLRAIGEWGLRDLDYARRLARTHNAATIRQAWKLAGEGKGSKDRAGLAAYYLKNGSAAASLKREAAKAAKAEDRARAQAAAVAAGMAAIQSAAAVRAELEADRAIVRRAIEARPDWLRERLSAAMDARKMAHGLRGGDWRAHALSSAFVAQLAREVVALESGARRIEADNLSEYAP
jgi:hypothetical protein